MQSGALRCTASARGGSINPLLSVQRNPDFAELPHFRAGNAQLENRCDPQCVHVVSWAQERALFSLLCTALVAAQGKVGWKVLVTARCSGLQGALAGCTVRCRPELLILSGVNRSRCCDWLAKSVAAEIIGPAIGCARNVCWLQH